MNILEIIKELEEEKRQNKITPSHALFIPLRNRALQLGMSNDSIANQLNDLYKQGKIKVGKTINDKFITIV